MDYGNEIRNHREDEGLKQFRVAQKIGIANSTLSQYETGCTTMTEEMYHHAKAAIHTLLAERAQVRTRLAEAK